MGSNVSVPNVTATAGKVPTKGYLKKTSFSSHKTFICAKTGKGWTVSFPGGLKGPIVFRKGTSSDSPILMTVDGVKYTPFEISLPAFPKLKRPAKAEILSWRNKFIANDIYFFNISVGGYYQKFEWRATSGADVKRTGTSNGWKLVRTGSANRKRENATKNLRTTGIASDGGEIVALWGGKTNERYFLLCGSGESLGPVFALMALATAVTIDLYVLRLQEERRRTNNYLRNNYLSNDLSNDYLTNDYLTNDYLTNDYLTNDYLTNDYLTNDATNDYLANDYLTNDYLTSDYT